MMVKRDDGPKRTHADLLHAATGAYAEAHANLRTAAERAAAEWKAEQENAEVVAAIRNRRNADALDTQQQRGNGNGTT